MNIDPSVIQSRLALCAAALAGSAGVVSNANAVIVTSTASIAVPNNIDGVYINFVTGATATAGSGAAGWDFNPYSASGQLQCFFPSAPATSHGAVSTGTVYLDLANGTTIGPASIFAANVAGTTGSPFLSAGTRVMGFRFFNESTSAINFGYAIIETGSITGFPATIRGWSYENSGAPITVNTVPAPAAAGLLSLSALALGGRRRKA